MGLSQQQLVAIDWMSQPDADQMTRQEFCDIMAELGYPMVPRTVQRWMNENEEFKAALAEARSEVEQSDDVFARRSRRWALLQLISFYRDKKNAPSPRLAALKAIMEETKGLVEAGTVELDSASDDTLIRMALSRDVTVVGMTRAQMTELVGGLEDDGAA